jgi:hypothetical protein
LDFAITTLHPRCSILPFQNRQNSIVPFLSRKRASSTKTTMMKAQADNTRESTPFPEAHGNSTWTARSAMNSAVAGYVAGIAGVVVGHPLDSAKVWLQTNSVGQNKHLVDTSSTAKRSSAGAKVPAVTSSSSSAMARSVAVSSSSSTFANASANMSTLSTSLSEAATTTTTAAARVPTAQPNSPFALKSSVRTLRALYSGISMPLATVGIVQSLNFASYDGIRRSLHQRDHPDNTNGRDYLENDSLQNITAAGFISGCGMACLTAPMLLVKTRQQITGNGFRQTLAESFRGVGVGESSMLFRQRPAFLIGFGPHFLAESLGRGVYFATYEYCKREYARRNNDNNDNGVFSSSSTISLRERMFSAGAAGIVCWCLIFPLDSLRSRLYGQITSHPKNTMEMMRSMYQENGARGFFRGFGVTVLRAGPVAAVILPMYDFLLEQLVASQH